MLENHWNRLRIQLAFLRGVWHIFDEQHAQIQEELLHTLQAKLSAAASKVEVATKYTTGARRLGYLLFVRQSMDRLMADLDDWQKVFDPTWFLIIRISNPLIDTGIEEWRRLQTPEVSTPNDSPVDTLDRLRHIQLVTTPTDSQAGGNVSISLGSSGLKDAAETPILFTESRVIQRPRSTKLMIIETVPAPETAESIAIFKRNVQNLARKLTQLEPGTSGLLHCYGTVKRQSPQKRLLAIDLIFRTPDQYIMAPVTLRQLLLERPGAPPSLTQVVGLARQVARAISFFHTCDFVHKSVRPENMLVFLGNGEDDNADSVLGPAFLVGYSQLRDAYFHTELRGDGDWHRNLYRHPQRQGVIAQQRYIMQHDIYSLGVCLLEMGLWQSFVLYDENQPPSLPDGLGLVLPDQGTQVQQSVDMATLNKNQLVSLAQTRLAPRTGDVYASVVLACLTCLDPGNNAFGNEEDLKDEDGVLVGVRFIEQILMQLEKIVV